MCWTAEGNRIHDVIVCDTRPNLDVVDLQRAAPDNVRISPGQYRVDVGTLLAASIAGWLHQLTAAARPGGRLLGHGVGVAKP